MLRIVGVSAGYGTGDVIHGIEMEVGAAEIVALVGANGAGKSTLVQTVSGLLPVRAGAIWLDGARIERLSPRERLLRGVAHVPEGRQVFAGLTLRDNLRLGGYLRAGHAGDAELRRGLDEVCSLFPVLSGRLDEPAANLSGGQQQMLAIARGLMAAPKILILDEPSLGLSPILVNDIFALIGRLREQGRTILLAEQNARLSLAIADRGYVLEQGRTVLTGTGRELLDNPEIAGRYLGAGEGAGAAEDTYHLRLAGRLARILQG